jgi:hypothetical protein
MVDKITSTRQISTKDIENQVYYDPTSPSGLRWLDTLFMNVKGKVQPHHFHVKDNVAGSLTGSHGYWSVRINKIQYLAHRLIYLLNYGEIPNLSFIDHVDGNRKNNVVDNLRLVSRETNNRNQKKRCREDFVIDGVLFKSEEVPMGISWDSSRNRWIASYVELDGTKVQKQFNPRTGVYKGIDNPLFSAYNDAINWRNSMIAQLNLKGAGYTDTHGNR